MKMQSLTKLFLVAGLSCLIGTSLFAQSTWNGSVDNNWATANNWTPSGVPSGGSNPLIALPNAIVNESTGFSCNLVQVAGDITGGGTAPTMNILGGTCNGYYTYTGCLNSGGGTNLTGITNFTSGLIQRSGGLNYALYIGDSGANNTGYYNFGSSTAVGAPTYNGQTGAQVHVATGASDTGVLSLSGYGTFSTTGSNSVIYIASYKGNGTLNVTGGNLSITTGAMVLGATSGTATLNETIDSTGISTIFCSTPSSFGGTKGLAIGGTTPHFNLTLGTGFSTTVGHTFTLIDSAVPITGTFTGLAEGATISDAGYTFSVTYTGVSSYTGGDAFALTTTAVPEPQTWAMLFSGIGMLMGFRRMRRNG